MPQLFCSGSVLPTHTPTVVASAGENRLEAPAYPLISHPHLKWSGGAAQDLLREGLRSETPLPTL